MDDSLSLLSLLIDGCQTQFFVGSTSSIFYTILLNVVFHFSRERSEEYGFFARGLEIAKIGRRREDEAAALSSSSSALLNLTSIRLYFIFVGSLSYSIAGTAKIH